MRSFVIVFALLICTGALSGSAIAADLNAAHRDEAVKSIAELIADHYYDPEKAEAYAADLRAGLAQGAYMQAESPEQLAGLLTEKLQKHDPHFTISWSPVVKEQGGDTAQPAPDAWREAARSNNYGFEKVEHLTGNIGYLDLRGFYSPGEAGATAVAAMNFLANSDAVIIDLRQNGGGDPAMVALLASYFFDPEPRHLNNFYWRTLEGTDHVQLWTVPHVEGKRMPDMPLYILVSPRTGSAGEAFPYHLQAMKRAVIVGQPTAGAANPGGTFQAAQGFSIFISTGAPKNPITSKNWEGTGVIPDVPVAAEDDALTVAKLLAWEKIAASTKSSALKQEIAWAQERHGLSRAPVKLSPRDRKAYIGKYGGRRVFEKDGRLYYQRGKRAPMALIAAGGGRFFIEGLDDQMLSFERRNGEVPLLVLTSTNGGRSESRRGED